MANRFEKGKHIFFLFKNGYTVQDSQLKPRYYLEERTAEKYLPYGEEIVEYAPVVHGKWKFQRMTGEKTYWSSCSNCGILRWFKDSGHEQHYCDHCGAKMDGGRKES